MRSTFALVAVLVLAGCAGSTPAGNQTSYELAQIQPYAQAPLAVGQTLRLDFHEHVCHSTHDSRGNGEANKTCDAWYTPAGILATVQTPTFCTVQVTGAATIVITKTAPPTQFSFGCSITVVDPQTHAEANPGA